MKKSIEPCPACGHPVHHSLKPKLLQSGGTTVIVNRVPIATCTHCGAEHISAATSKRLDSVLAKAVADHVLVLVRTFKG